MAISKLLEGNESFIRKKFKKHKERFVELVQKGQNPKVLFIGCSDSRVVPTLITDTKPGDLFIVRNIGNFVPPFSPDDEFHSTAAAIEYAVSVLEVDEIIVCGHSYCGAIESMYKEINDPNLIHVKKWLELGESTKKYVEGRLNKNASKREKLTMSEKVSVIFQMVNLLTYPDVEKRVEDGRLNIRGWYYKIETGKIEIYDQEKNDFVQI
jgi:carbonic anhydrase